METNNDSYAVVNNLSPAFPVHPGSLLKEELDAHGIKHKDFASQIGIQATHLSALIHGRRDITPAVAAKLETGLPGISADFWLRFQKNYNMDMQRYRVRSSSVAGYVPALDQREAILAEPESDYAGRIQATISLPAGDHDLLDILLPRLGWRLV